MDVVVIGSGPNGLAAAVELAKAGLEVLVVEGDATPGGGARTQELTLPGFQHDVCSTVHPLGIASPFFRSIDLAALGVDFVQPDSPLVHVMSGGRAVLLERELAAAARSFGADGDVYGELLAPFVERFDDLVRATLAPLRWPEDPLLLARFGLAGLPSAEHLLRRFSGAELRALLSGIAAHAMLPLSFAATAAFTLVLLLSAHAVGWPLLRGGSQRLVDALVRRLGELGGRVETDRQVRHLGDLPPARAYVFDVTPRQLLDIAGYALPLAYRQRLERYRYGAGVCKVDWALDAPVPWTDAQCSRAATVHLGGSFDEVAAAEAAVHAGRVPERPFVIFVQPTLFDAARAPEGKHIAWAYCHMPHGCDVDASELIETQVERAAPGFRDLVLARSVRTAPQMQAHNPNYVGGDINGGMADLAQLFFRPAARVDPYSTPNPRIFFCSSSTPPGGGVHGMCGYWAARSVRRNGFSRS